MDAKEIEKFVEQHGRHDEEEEKYSLQNNFLGVFPINKIKKIIDKTSEKPFPFCILNTDEYNAPGQHWFLFHTLKNMKKPSCFLFDSFGKLSLQLAFINNDEKIMKKFINNLKPLKDKENHFDFYRWNVNCNKFISLTHDEKSNLTPTCRGFFIMLASYLKQYNIKNDKKETSIDLFGLIDIIQDVKKTTCGVFCLYYIYHLFYPDECYDLQSEKGDITTVKKLINCIFVDQPTSLKNKNINEAFIKEFIKNFNIKVDTEDESLMI